MPNVPLQKRIPSIYLFLGLGLALAISATLIILVVASGHENDNSRATQKAVVQYETANLLTAFSDKLTTMIFWQDAYDKAAISWDQKWVAYQFGPYLNAIHINIVAMFDSRGHLLFSYMHDLNHPLPGAHVASNENVREVIAKLLATEPTRPLRNVMATVDIDGTPFFAVAGFITPETDSQFPVPFKNKRVVIFMTQATAASYATLSNSFGVSGVKVSAKIANEDNYINVPLQDAAGDIATRVWWRPELPGNQLLKLLVPFSIAVFLALACMQGFVVRRWLSLQRALHRAEAKAESASEESRAKSAFVGTISHELRTPLNAVIGFSDIMMRQLFGPLGSARYQEYAREIHESGNKLLGKVNDLIEIARIEARDTALERGPVNADDLICDALENLAGPIQRKHMQVHHQPPPQKLLCLAAPTSLRQVLIRILDNAVKFSRDGGPIQISTREACGELLIDVRDAGIGIAGDNLEKLCKPFVQVEGHMVRNSEGVGLGLAISKGLMQAMGGELVVSSAVGAGTIITLRLPALSAHELAEQAAA